MMSDALHLIFVCKSRINDRFPLLPKGLGRGKSGLHRAGCRITSGGGDSKASATEIYRQARGFINVFTLVASVVKQ